MQLLEAVNTWVQKGFTINYLITDQISNGYGSDVEAGYMPRFTYYFYIDVQEEMIWDYSVDRLEDGFKLALEWLSQHQSGYLEPKL